MEKDRIKTDDELLVERFFAQNMIDVADDGFTRRVMNSLPRQARRRNKLWTLMCLVAAATFFLLFDGAGCVRVFLTDVAGDVVGYLASINLSVVSVLTTMVALFVFFVVVIVNNADNRSIL